MHRPLLIVGGGMHGRIVLDVAKALNVPVAGFLDDTMDDQVRVDDIRVLGGTDRLDDRALIEANDLLIAIGNNIVRRRFANRVRGNGGRLATLIHPSSWISPTARISSGTVLVGANMVFSAARIEEDVLVDPDTTIGAESIIGSGSYLSPGCHLASRVICGEECFMGIGAVAVPEVRVGRRAIVGAGAVVTRSVPDEKLAVGNPAKVIGEAHIDEVSPYPARGRATSRSS